MISQKPSLSQRQSLQQKLSPQQIQYIKLLQMPTQVIEQRIKEEIEMNPTLEEAGDEPEEMTVQADDSDDERDDSEEREIEDDREIDWDSYFSDDEPGSGSTSYNPDQDDWRDLPKPYQESQLEKLEKQVWLLDLSEKERFIADQILGSIDDDGYFRRELSSVADGIAFQTGVPVQPSEVENVLKRIQRLDPPGIAARNLRECLLVQIELSKDQSPAREHVLKMVRDHWEDVEKKHFQRLMKRLNLSEDEIRDAFHFLQTLDPKPGFFESASDAGNYVIPDFEVFFQESTDDDSSEDAGDFVIRLNRRNLPDMKISNHYMSMLEHLKGKKKQSREDKETHHFIKDKMESAKWFIDSLRQRQNTLMNVMQTIVALQEDFFRRGKGLKPMILKDVAERVNLDVSTISRVVNGKFVQTPFGVYELRYFFNEGVGTDSGEDVASREVKNRLAEIIEKEPKDSPYSDQKLMEFLRKDGFQVARRTVTKYREQLNLPVARLRKELV